MKDKTAHKIGIIISIIAWWLSWIILVFKLDMITYIGFMLYGLGLSGIIIFIFVPEIYQMLKNKENNKAEKREK